MSCTELVIRCANKQDMEAVGQMIICRISIHELEAWRTRGVYWTKFLLLDVNRLCYRELAAYHKTTEFPKTTWRDLQRDGFESESPAFRCIVAERKKNNQLIIVGYAIYFPIYSSREGRSLMLEDIFVKADERHHGIGNLLFNTVVKEAYSMGCRRMDFHVAEWNKARSWYEGKGAVNITGREGRCCWRLSGDALRAAASGEN